MVIDPERRESGGLCGDRERGRRERWGVARNMGTMRDFSGDEVIPDISRRPRGNLWARARRNGGGRDHEMWLTGRALPF